jgi:1,4-dihydroxy-2-naphthoate octaprenyltransferase
MPTFKSYVVATRPWSFSMSVISVSLGTLIASRHVPILWGWFAAVALGVVLVHAAGNVLNDYFDTESRVDQPDSGTVLYRPHPVFAGLMSPRAVLVEGVVLVAAAACIGLAIAAFRTLLVFWIALAGLLLTVFYTGGPVRLKYRALGEVAVFLIWGPLQFQGAYAVQTRELSAEALVASIPFGVLVALVLFANNIRDIEHDGRTGIRTLAILLGRHGSLVAFAGFIAFAYLYVLGAVVLGALSPWALLVFLSLPTALGLLRRFRVSFPEMADALTAKLDTVFGILFVAALILDRLVTP